MPVRQAINSRILIVLLDPGLPFCMPMHFDKDLWKPSITFVAPDERHIRIQSRFQVFLAVVRYKSNLCRESHLLILTVAQT
jgi:hypothetical protein